MPGSTIEKRPDHLPVPVPGFPVRRRESEALIPRAFRSGRRNKAVTVPLAVPPVTWTAAEIMHACGMGDDALLAGAVLTLCVAFFARHKWDRAAERWYAFLSAAALWLWTWAAVTFGPAAGTPGEVLGALLVVLSVAWGIPWYRHYRIRGRRQRQRDLGQWQGLWNHFAPAWGLGGSHVVEAEDNGVTLRWRVQLWAGHQTLADVKAAVPRMESGLQGLADAGMIRVRKVTGNPSLADVIITRANPLQDDVEWDESLAPGSVLDPWYPGKTESGRWRPVRQLDGMFALGETGSGKSTMLLTRLLSLCGCRDAFSILIDLKGGRSARPVLAAGAADWVITTQAEAEMAYLLGVAEILARMEGEYDGHEQITPTESTPAIFFHGDEIHMLSSVNKGSKQAADSMSTVATTGRAARVYEDAVTQYGALEASVRYEETRMNLFLRFVFRMRRADMAAFAIKEWVQLDVSKLDGPGECYAQDEPETDPERMRGVNVTHDAFRELAPARIEKRGPKKKLKLWCGNQPCPAGGTWQEYLDSRWERLPKAFREISPQYQEWTRERGEPEEDDAPPAAPRTVTAAPAAAPPPETPASAAAAIAAETSGLDIAPTATAQAQAAGGRAARVQAFCDVLAAGPASPAALGRASGLPRSTVNDHLRRLLDRGAVTRPEEGVYVVVPGRSVHAELGAIRAGDDALMAGVPALRLVQ
jgi:DNA-binding transcriptional ArsR family regulator